MTICPLNKTAIQNQARTHLQTEVDIIWTGSSFRDSITQEVIGTLNVNGWNRKRLLVELKYPNSNLIQNQPRKDKKSKSFFIMPYNINFRAFTGQARLGDSHLVLCYLTYLIVNGVWRPLVGCPLYNSRLPLIALQLKRSLVRSKGFKIICFQIALVSPMAQPSGARRNCSTIVLELHSGKHTNLLKQ